MKNLTYLLALNRMSKVGPRTVKKLLGRWPDLSELFQHTAKELQAIGLPDTLAETITGFNLDEVQLDLEWQQAENQHHLLTWESPHYPALLREIADPPVVLYAKGQLSAFENPCLAVVGSRNPSVTGSENANYFSQQIAAHKVTIVSGLALGIDAQAHQGCLEAGGQTIAVMGTGIDYIYPRRHSALAEQISVNGLLLSEFPLKTSPIAGHFPRRNRIISGLSLCTLVIEAAIKSGSLITARLAMEQNRDVLAIPGSIHNPLARGCHHLVQQGAKLVVSVADVLEELNLEFYHQPEDKIPLASEKENLVQFIGFETTSIDQILVRSGRTIGQITCELAELEIKGTVLSVPGGYMRCNNER